MEPTELKHLYSTPEGIALRMKWERILESEGLSMESGKPPRGVVPLFEQDSVCCSKCIGYHTYEDDCGLAEDE